MKYIRTKDGQIIDLESWQYDKYNKCYFNKKYRLQDNVYQNLIYKQDIIKQADTIEELCDEYVCVMPSGETFLLDKNTDLKAQVNYIGNVYGSIWIDGDLIKVAKMNKEGELELL